MSTIVTSCAMTVDGLIESPAPRPREARSLASGMAPLRYRPRATGSAR